MQSPENNLSLGISFLSSLFKTAHAYRKWLGTIMSLYGMPELTAWPMLMIKHMGGEIRPGKLAQALGIDSSTIVRIADMLVEHGVVEKETDANDRRAKVLRLTDRGREIVTHIEVVLDSVFQRPKGAADYRFRNCQHFLVLLRQSIEALG